MSTSTPTPTTNSPLAEWTLRSGVERVRSHVGDWVPTLHRVGTNCSLGDRSAPNAVEFDRDWVLRQLGAQIERERLGMDLTWDFCHVCLIVPVEAPDPAPYRSWLHYNPTVEGTWIGAGRLLNAVCGQSEYIGVTSHPEAVDCAKCLASIAKAASAQGSDSNGVEESHQGSITVPR